MSFDVENTGAVTIDAFTIRVLDHVGTELESYEISETLLPGISTTLNFSYKLPDTALPDTLQIQVTPEGTEAWQTADLHLPMYPWRKLAPKKHLKDVT